MLTKRIKVFKLSHVNSTFALTVGHLNPTLNNPAQVLIVHASHVSSQYSFGLPLRMNGMHKMQFDHVCINLLPLVLLSRVF